MLKLVDAGTIGGPGAKQVVEEVFRTGAEPAEVVQAKGLAQVSDEGAIEAVVDQVLAASPAEVEKHRGGKKDLHRLLRRQGDEGAARQGQPGGGQRPAQAASSGAASHGLGGLGRGAGGGGRGRRAEPLVPGRGAGRLGGGGRHPGRARPLGRAAACLVAAGYFTLRLFYGLGRKR